MGQNIILKIRKQLKLSQIEFAKKIGYKRQATISDFENGKKPIPKTLELLLIHLQKNKGDSK